MIGNCDMIVFVDKVGVGSGVIGVMLVMVLLMLVCRVMFDGMLFIVLFSDL